MTKKKRVGCHGVSNKGDEVPSFNKRICECGQELNRYNPNKKCYICVHKDSRKAAGLPKRSGE